MASCVRFSRALSKLCTTLLYAAGGTNLLTEIGPHSSLTGLAKQILTKKRETVGIKHLLALI